MLDLIGEREFFATVTYFLPLALRVPRNELAGPRGVLSRKTWLGLSTIDPVLVSGLVVDSIKNLL